MEEKKQKQTFIVQHFGSALISFLLELDEKIYPTRYQSSHLTQKTAYFTHKDLLFSFNTASFLN